MGKFICESLTPPIFFLRSPVKNSENALAEDRPNFYTPPNSAYRVCGSYDSKAFQGARMKKRNILSKTLQSVVFSAFLGILTVLSLCAVSAVFGQDEQPTESRGFVPPDILRAQTTVQQLPQPVSTATDIQQVSGQMTGNPYNTVQTASLQSAQVTYATDDPVLGKRIAKISNQLKEIPNTAGQIWREFDITPYTKGRNFPAGTRPEQTIIDWILRQTKSKTNWNSSPFSILTADGEHLYVYQTPEIQLEIADIVDRFITPQYANDSCKIRVVSISKPDWISRGHRYLTPIPIITPGVQGWVLEKEGTQLLLQEMGRRTDFREIAPPQFLIPNGIAHNVTSKRQKSYLRDIQANTTAMNGYAEDRVTIDEGFSVSFTPLSVLDGDKIDAIIQLDIVQIEKMMPLMIDMPSTTNPRQRVQIEAPQVSHYRLDEHIRWPKNKILLLDLGTIPLPSRETSSETTGFFAGLTKSLPTASTSRRANILLLIEHVSGAAAGAVQPQQAVLQGQQQQGVQNGAVQQGVVPPANTAVGTNPLYWGGRRQ